MDQASPQKKRKTRISQARHYSTESGLADHIAGRYGPGWSLKAGKSLTEAGQGLLMKDFRPGVGCCTITALTFVFDYLRRARGLAGIPASLPEIFAVAENAAVPFGYSRTRGRTNPFLLRWVIRRIWKQFGYSGRARSSYLVRARDLICEINQDRPALLNIAFHDYHAHTVVLAGYQIWRQDTGRHRELLFLQVYDGWTTGSRFIDYHAMSHICSPGFTPFSLARILPPG